MMITTNRLQQSRFARGCRVCCRILLLFTGLSLCNVALAGEYSDREAAQQVIAAAQEAGVDPGWAQQLIDAAERRGKFLKTNYRSTRSFEAPKLHEMLGS